MPSESFPMDISFSFEGAIFQVLKFTRGVVTESVPSHSHGNGNYEIHFIPPDAERLSSTALRIR